jgi:hypothetical protein
LLVGVAATAGVGAVETLRVWHAMAPRRTSSEALIRIVRYGTAGRDNRAIIEKRMDTHEVVITTPLLDFGLMS